MGIDNVGFYLNGMGPVGGLSKGGLNPLVLPPNNSGCWVKIGSGPMDTRHLHGAGAGVFHQR